MQTIASVLYRLDGLRPGCGFGPGGITTGAVAALWTQGFCVWSRCPACLRCRALICRLGPRCVFFLSLCRLDLLLVHREGGHTLLHQCNGVLCPLTFRTSGRRGLTLLGRRCLRPGVRCSNALFRRLLLALLGHHARRAEAQHVLGRGKPRLDTALPAHAVESAEFEHVRHVRAVCTDTSRDHFFLRRLVDHDAGRRSLPVRRRAPRRRRCTLPIWLPLLAIWPSGPPRRGALVVWSRGHGGRKRPPHAPSPPFGSTPHLLHR